MTEEMLMGDVCLTLENCGRHDLSNALSDEISRLRAALTARDKAIAAAEEALRSADTVLWLSTDVDRMELSGHLDHALAVLAAVKEQG